MSCKARRVERRRIQVWGLAADQLRHQPPGRGAHADPEHTVAGRQPEVTMPGRAAQQRQVVAAQRPPAVPLLLLPGPDRLAQVLRRATLERAQAAAVEAAVVAGELHRAAEAE